MVRNNHLTAALLSATMLATLVLRPHEAAAQSAAQLQAIESQINALQAEIRAMKVQMARRDSALRQAQAEAAEARSQARLAALHTQQIETTVSHAPAPTIVYAAPPPAAPAPPPLPTGSFRLGAVTVTLGGFAAAEGVYRSRNEAASIDTNFNTGIPLRNSPNYHVPNTARRHSRAAFPC